MSNINVGEIRKTKVHPVHMGNFHSTSLRARSHLAQGAVQSVRFSVCNRAGSFPIWTRNHFSYKITRAYRVRISFRWIARLAEYVSLWHLVYARNIWLLLSVSAVPFYISVCIWTLKNTAYAAHYVCFKLLAALSKVLKLKSFAWAGIKFCLWVMPTWNKTPI